MQCRPIFEVYHRVFHAAFSKKQVDRSFLESIKNFPSSDDPIAFAREYRQWKDKCRHLYAVQFSTGVVMIGRCKDAKQWLVSHRARAASMKQRITGYIIDKNPVISEKELIGYCASVGTLVFGKENFSNISLRQILNFLRKAKKKAKM